MSQDIDRESTGKRIKQIRLRMGYTAEKFGKELAPEAQRGLVSSWENGRYSPTPARLKKIAELGNVSVNYLLHGVEDETDKIMKLELENEQLKLENAQLKHEIITFVDRHNKVLTSNAKRIHKEAYKK